LGINPQIWSAWTQSKLPIRIRLAGELVIQHAEIDESIGYTNYF
jgi:hypothetical protein